MCISVLPLIVFRTVRVYQSNLNSMPEKIFLDKYLYDVAIPDGKVDPTTATTILQAIYTQCSIDTSAFLLFHVGTCW